VSRCRTRRWGEPGRGPAATHGFHGETLRVAAEGGGAVVATWGRRAVRLLPRRQLAGKFGMRGLRSSLLRPLRCRRRAEVAVLGDRTRFDPTHVRHANAGSYIDERDGTQVTFAIRPGFRPAPTESSCTPNGAMAGGRCVAPCPIRLSAPVTTVISTFEYRRALGLNRASRNRLECFGLKEFADVVGRLG